MEAMSGSSVLLSGPILIMSMVHVTTKGQADEYLWSLLLPEGMLMSVALAATRDHAEVCDIIL